MKINLPESIADITLNQFQEYDKLLKSDFDIDTFNQKKIEIFTDIDNSKIKLIAKKDYSFILEQIDKALNEVVDFTPRFTLKGIEFGFIPNFDKISVEEYRDLTIYGVETETLNKVMAILFRPILNKDGFKNYSIESYNGTEAYSELMKEIPMSYVNGALVFFSNLANELTDYTQRFMRVE